MTRDDSEGKPVQRSPRWLQISIGLAVIVLLLSVSFVIVFWVLTRSHGPVAIPAVGDLLALLFGASSLALVIFSLLIAAIAIVGWQTLKTGVREEIEDSMGDKITSLENELRGRVLAVLGMMLGMFYLWSEKRDEDRSDEEERADLLNEALDLCRQAYKILKNVAGNSKYMALNNFLYFSCIRGAPGMRDLLLSEGRELKKAAQEKLYWEGLLTYCRVELNPPAADR